MTLPLFCYYLTVTVQSCSLKQSKALSLDLRQAGFAGWDKIQRGRYQKVCHSLLPLLQTQVYLFSSLPACLLKTPVCLWHLVCRQWLQRDIIFIPKEVVGGKGQSAASCSTSGVRLQSTKNFWLYSHKTSVSINMDIICWSQAGFETLNKAVLAGWVGQKFL